MSFFNKPYREKGTPKSKLITIFAFGLFIFLFLFIFKPFGMYQIEKVRQFFISLGFGIITTFVLLVFKFLIDPAIVNEKWTIGKNLLLDLSIASSIGAANYFYMSLIFKLEFRLIYLLYGIWTAILVGIIPVTITYFLVYNRMYRDALKKIDRPEELMSWEPEVTITAGNPANDFRMNPKQILFICSNDNYVTIVSLKNNQPAKTTIRGTLKSVESELKRNSSFIRCHKCYIVNMKYVAGVTGNSQNMKIRIHSSPTEIPVARSKANLITSFTSMG